MLKELKNGVFWNLILSFGRQGLNFLATIILARLLTPEDYGLMGAMAVFIAVSETIIDGGLGGALIKKSNAQNTDYSTLTIYNITSSIILFLIVFFCAPFLEEIYNNILLPRLIRLYFGVIIIEAISVVPKIILMKELRFKEYSLCYILSGSTGLVTAILLAINNYGVYSLIWQYIISSLVLSILLIARVRYKFSFTFSISSFKEMFSFGANTTFANIIKNGTENLYINVVARIAPWTTAGFVNQSYKLQNVTLSMVNAIIDSALFPILCKEKDKDIVSKSLILNRYSFLIFALIFTFLIINSEFIISVILGEQWIKATPYLRIFLFMGLVQIMTAFNRNILKSLAITRHILYIELISLFVSLVTLAATISLGVHYIIISLMMYVITRLFVVISFLHINGICPIRESFRTLLLSIVTPLSAYCICNAFEPFIQNLLLLNLFYFTLVIGINEILNIQVYREIKIVIINRLHHVLKRERSKKESNN